MLIQFIYIYIVNLPNIMLFLKSPQQMPEEVSTNNRRPGPGEALANRAAFRYL